MVWKRIGIARKSGMHFFFLFPTLEGVQLFNPLRAFVGSTSSICITLVSINTSIEVAASTLGLTALSSSINTWIDCINTHLALTLGIDYRLSAMTFIQRLATISTFGQLFLAMMTGTEYLALTIASCTDQSFIHAPTRASMTRASFCSGTEKSFMH